MIRVKPCELWPYATPSEAFQGSAKVGPEGFEQGPFSRGKPGKGPRRVTAQSHERLTVLVDGVPIELSPDQAAAVAKVLGGLPETAGAVS